MKKKAEQATLKPEAAARLRQAGDAGSGWYAAVARAAEAWEPKHRPTRPQPTKPEKTDAERLEAEENARRRQKKEEERAKRKREEERLEKQLEEERQRRAERDGERDRKEKEKQEHLKAFEARRQEEKRRAEQDRKKRDSQEQARMKKLGGFFALEENEDDDKDRDAERLRVMEKQKKQHMEEMVSLAKEATPTILPSSSHTNLAESTGVPGLKGDLGSTLGFESGLDIAQALMRQAERKRKGRCRELGGPPRGVSPWRDKGIRAGRAPAPSIMGSRGGRRSRSR